LQAAQCRRRLSVGILKVHTNGEGFKRLESWLVDNDLLLLWRDRQRPLVVMPWRTYLKLMRAYQRTCGEAAEDTPTVLCTRPKVVREPQYVFGAARCVGTCARKSSQHTRPTVDCARPWNVSSLPILEKGE
jgi:hypothetical protein